MPTPALPPPFLPVSALSIELDAFVAATAALHGGFGDARSTFECSFARQGTKTGFFVLAGIEPLLDALERFKLKTDELSWLESIGAIDAQAKRRLADMRFSCDVDAAMEGSVVFASEPVITVEGPFWQAQLVGSFVRSALGSATRAATKAARCVLAADGGEIIESSGATAHRLGGNPLVSRAAYVGGAHGTTSALASRRYGIPARASLPLRLVLAAPNEQSAFDAWLGASGERAILRIDHREAASALAHAIEALRKRRSSPSTWHDTELAIEISGGDHAGIARLAIEMFEEAGLSAPVIVASGGIDEFRIAELCRENVPVSGFIVSSLDVDDASWVAQYDLAAIESGGSWNPRIRLGRTAASSSDPGRKVIVRYFDEEGHPIADVAHATNERIHDVRDIRFTERATGFPSRLKSAKSAQLLTNVMREGKRVSLPQPTRDIRAYSMASVAALHPQHRRLEAPTYYPVGMTPALAALKTELIAAARGA
jgi:nicotinate phosphoribosyltransferase